MVTFTSTPDHSLTRHCFWALGYALRRKTSLALLLAAMLVKVGLDVLKPWPLKILVDHVLQDRPMTPALAQAVQALPGPFTPDSLLTWCVAATVLLFLLGWAVTLAISLASLAFGQRMAYDLGGELFRHQLGLPLFFHRGQGVGDSVRRVSADCGSVASMVKDSLLPILAAAVSLVVMFTIMWRLDPVLTFLALLVVPAMVLVFGRYAGPMLERGYRQQQAEGEIYNVVEQTMSGVPVVQAFCREDHADDRFAASTDATLSAVLSATNLQVKYKVFMGSTTALGTAAMLWIGAQHVLDGRLSVGSILVFLSYLGSLYAPLETMMYLSSTVQAAAGSSLRVRQVMDTKPAVTNRPGALQLPSVRGHVRLEDVTFGYETGRPVLRGITLDVLPGQTVAIVGCTGAGKTTLVNLVPRSFDPWQGRVLLDGHDVRGVRLASLRQQVAVVLQESFLFPRTIRENIAYGRPGASQQEIEAAAKAANAHFFIERLPRGYETVVGERGATLSGGERQRLSIARALLRDAPILILDEPTSALDTDTEGLLLRALEELMKGRTTLIIAHRLSTIRHADWILVLDDGKVAEAGTHPELLARKGLYAHLHETQFGLPAASPAGEQP
jgi:ATP-binding cassette subfamily B protein/subfamily B ATP-binding cassette protein MsbA